MKVTQEEMRDLSLHLQREADLMTQMMSTLQRLQEENHILRRRLSIMSHPAGRLLDDPSVRLTLTDNQNHLTYIPHDLKKEN